MPKKIELVLLYHEDRSYGDKYWVIREVHSDNKRVKQVVIQSDSREIGTPPIYLVRVEADYLDKRWIDGFHKQERTVRSYKPTKEEADALARELFEKHTSTIKQRLEERFPKASVKIVDKTADSHNPQEPHRYQFWYNSTQPSK